MKSQGILLGLVLVVVACRGDDDPPVGAGSCDLADTACGGHDPGDDPWDDDPSCECNTIVTCNEGTVRSGGPDYCPPCDPAETYHCEKGCWWDSWDEEQLLSPIEPYEMCFETYSHSVGDPCSADADCLPTAAHETDGGLVTLYLECDEGAGTCVEGPAPEPVVDWLGPCDPAVLDPAVAAAPPFGGGYLEDPSCSSGWCFMATPDSEGCTYAGCVSACAGDWECPPGTWCEQHGQAPDHATPFRGVCLPYDLSDMACYP